MIKKKFSGGKLLALAVYVFSCDNAALYHQIAQKLEQTFVSVGKIVNRVVKKFVQA